MAWSTKKIIGVSLSVLFALMLAGGAAFYFLIIGIIKGSEPYKISVQTIETNPVVAEKIGAVKGYGFFPMGSVHVQGDGGEAELSLRVKGEKGKAKVKTVFYRAGGKWHLQDAFIFVPEEPDGIPILSLEITSVTFHSESVTGPVNEKRHYVLGETVYWNVVVEKAHKRGGKVSLKEGLKITDQKGKVIAENPELVIYNDTADQGVVTFENHATPPGPGEYTLKTIVTDRFSNRQAVREDKVQVLDSSKLGISNLYFREKSAEGEIKNNSVYQKGDSVYVTFQVVGFTLQGGKISIAQDLYVLDNEDKVILEKPGILEVVEPWRKEDLLSLQNKVDVPDAGEYKLKLIIRDRNSNQNYTSLTDFTIR